jgi:predicted amidohydrolase YtcJ
MIIGARRMAELLASARVPVVLEPLLDLPGTFDQIGATLENAARLQRAGVPIMFTHFAAGTNQAHKVRQGAGVAVADGLPHDAALAALTSTPADVFGLGAAAGRITVGSPADLVLWSGDPLEVTSYAEHVWIGGRRNRCARGRPSCGIVIAGRDVVTGDRSASRFTRRRNDALRGDTCLIVAAIVHHCRWLACSAPHLATSTASTSSPTSDPDAAPRSAVRPARAFTVAAFKPHLQGIALSRLSSV